MQRINLVLVLMLMGVLTGTLKAQIDPLAASVTYLQDYSNKKAPEKVFVQTDRPFYASGENVWFTAWVFDAVSHKGQETSQTLYVQLLNPSGKVVLQRMLKVQQGITYGDLYLPQDLETGTYLIRAYTPWMMNFDARWYFRKQIPILNATQKSNAPKANASKELMTSLSSPISFFPEGGSLIAGIDQRVAFTLRDLKTFQRGVLETEQGLELDTLSISHASMGVFSILPQVGVDYYVRLYYQDRTERVKLPEVQPYGMALSAVMIDSTAFELIIRPVSLASDVTLIGHVRGNPVFSGTAAASPEGFKATILRKNLPPGITQFLLFDSNGSILGQRLLFNPPSTQTISFTVDPEWANKRSPVNLTLKPTLPDTMSMTYTISVAAVSKAPESLDEVDLHTYLYLISDVHQPIASPAQYLKRDPESLLKADLLMMTQRWERFDGTLIARNSGLGQEPGLDWITDPLAFKGKIQQKKNQKPISNEFFTLMVDPEKPTYYPIKTDAEGRFEVPNLRVADSVIVVVDGDPKAGRRPYELIIDPLHVPTIDASTYFALPSIPLDSIATDFAVKALNQIIIDQSYGLYNQVRRLGEVIVQAKVEPKPAVKESYNRIYGVADRTFVPTNTELSRGGNVLEFLKGKTGAFRITGSGSATRVTFARAATLTSTTTPLFFLDGIETDVSTMTRINIQNVGAVDILTEAASTSIFGARGSNGVISVFTFTGEREMDIKPDIVSQIAPGFHQARNFYAPDYTSVRELHKKTDIRSLLWWSPVLNTSREGKGTVQFYTSDETGIYRISIWGTTPEGEVMMGSRYFVVR